MNHRDAIEYHKYCLSYYRDSKIALSPSPTAYTYKLSQSPLKHLSAILQQQQLLVVCCSPVPFFALSLTTPSAHCCRHQDRPIIMEWYGRLASWYCM